MTAATWVCSCGTVAWQTYCQVCGADRPAETPPAAESDDLGALRAAAAAAVRPYARESYDRVGATPGRALMGEFRILATPERIRDLCDELEELRRDVQAMQDERL